MSRMVVHPLGWARVLRDRPVCIPKASSDTPATRLGNKYEAQAHVEMTRRYGDRYQSGLWFQYADAVGTYYCQIDGLLDCGSHYVVVEMKYNHVLSAWMQMKHLYGPVVSKWSNRPVRYVEMVKWYDPATIADRVQLLKDVERARENKFNVHVWRPRGETRELPSLGKLWTREAFT